MRKLTEAWLLSFCLLVLISSCSMQKQIAKQAEKDMLSDPGFLPAHVGISLYDPATQQYLYNHQADKFFIPASNMKLFTCYEAMKNLGDSLISVWYNDKGNGTIEVEANGDASFLQPDFKNQPVYNLLKKQRTVLLTDDNWK